MECFPIRRSLLGSRGVCTYYHRHMNLRGHPNLVDLTIEVRLIVILTFMASQVPHLRYFTSNCTGRHNDYLFRFVV